MSEIVGGWVVGATYLITTSLLPAVVYSIVDHRSLIGPQNTFASAILAIALVGIPATALWRVLLLGEFATLEQVLWIFVFGSPTWAIFGLFVRRANSSSAT